MIGVSSTKFCEESIESTLEKVSKEFGLWEIFSEGEQYLPLILKRLMSISKSYKVKYSIHAPIADVNIAALSERMREASTLELMAAMEQALELDVKTITIHPGIYSMVVHGQEQKSIERAKRSIRTLDRVIGEFGIGIAIENMPSFKFMLGQTAEQLNELIEGTEMGVCFDIGHANTTGQIDQMIDLFKDRIVNVHIHDNHGQQDEHLTIGEGNINFPPVLKRLSNYKGNYIIESKSLESAAESQKKLKAMLLQ